MAEMSDTVKVALYVRDITESGSGYVHRKDSITVRKYDYTMTRDVDSGKLADGLGTTDIFSVCIRVGARDNIRRFYECMTHSYSHTFSLVFNAKYGEDDNLYDYDGALLVDGYIVGIDEIYERTKADTEGRQMFLEMRIRVRRVTYIGENENLYYSF